jgi:hypothetical protein
MSLWCSGREVLVLNGRLWVGFPKVAMHSISPDNPHINGVLLKITIQSIVYLISFLKRKFRRKYAFYE